MTWEVLEREKGKGEEVETTSSGQISQLVPVDVMHAIEEEN